MIEWDITAENFPEMLKDSAEWSVRWLISILPLLVFQFLPLQSWGCSRGFRVCLATIAGVLSFSFLAYHLARAVAIISLFGGPFSMATIISTFAPLGGLLIAGWIGLIFRARIYSRAGTTPKTSRQN